MNRDEVVNFGGELGYNIEEKFSLITGLTFNQYSGLKENAKAWGLIPLELNTALRLQIIKDLWLKGDLFAWTGPHYLKDDGSPGKLPGATDLNAGLEFKITKNLNLWSQFNNIFNKEYQRWNQYLFMGLTLSPESYFRSTKRPSSVRTALPVFDSTARFGYSWHRQLFIGTNSGPGRFSKQASRATRIYHCLTTGYRTNFQAVSSLVVEYLANF